MQHDMESPTQPENLAVHPSAELLKHFPARIRERFAYFLATSDPAAADDVVLAIVREHVPSRKQGSTPALLTDSMSLQADLGIDSIAIADATFMLEEVFNVNIATKEIAPLRTVGDLREFIRRKLADS
jgi:acyl carrier protein